MSLVAKEPNKNPMQTESAKKKRTLEEFLKSDGSKPKGSSGSDKENNSPAKKKLKSPKNSNDDLVAKDDPLSSPLSSPPHDPSVLTALDSLPHRDPPKVSNDLSKKVPEKRKRTVLSAEEKAAKAAVEDAKKAEREAAKQKKAEEAAKAEELKRQKQAEREAKKREKEDELAKKKRDKEEKEKKKREREEEKEKKARGQTTLTSMFGLKSTTSKKDQSTAKTPGDMTDSAKTPTKTQSDGQTAYAKMFKEFYMKEHVRLAPQLLEMDDETRNAQTKILEEYINGTREHAPPSFNAMDVLELPYKVKRGRTFPSVKKIMTEFSSDSQTSQQANHLQELLNQVPVISIKFYEDVRPPYVGTISDYPKGLEGLKKLARCPIRKDILPLTYDYDSEAEWQEEDGEDIEDLDDEDDEEDDEDMADFLDDADDVGPARMVFSGGMEPESSGLCWENRKRGTSEIKMYKWRMEFILDKLEHHHSVDPFSTTYWETPKPAKSETGKEKSSTAANATKSSANANSSLKPEDPSANLASRTAPADAFQALNAGAGTKKSQQPLSLDLQERLKALVRKMPKLSKVGVIELFMADNENCNRTQVKNAYAELIVKVGKEHKVKGE